MLYFSCQRGGQSTCDHCLYGQKIKVRVNTGIAPGEVCTMSDRCSKGYVCNCAHHRRKLLFASTPMHCTCERV